MPGTWQSDFLQVVQTYRTLADFSNVLNLDSTRNAQAQQCALMMDANNKLCHYPPANWTCSTPDGTFAAGRSNIASRPAIASMPLYFRDSGNAQTMGHRRWFLSNTLQTMGIGSTSGYNCAYVTGGGGSAGKDWVAWPPNGTMPHTAMDFDAVGWTVQSDTIVLAGAIITVIEYPGAITRTMTAPVTLGAGFGSQYAISFAPSGWTSGPGKTYSISVEAGGRCIQSVSYVVNCSSIAAGGSGTSPTSPPTPQPTPNPTTRPPTPLPTTRAPSPQPTTRLPTQQPTKRPTNQPTNRPTKAPTANTNNNKKG
jgi:hypothetical protein